MPADAPRFFNVWLVQPNTVYRGVPFTVVCDWIQEGRLLARDCVRTPGAPAWEYLDAHPLFIPYFGGGGLPTAEDAAEALEPIEIDFAPKGHQEAEDEDVDMIPLIDISMVLLVFFMMTAQNLMTQAPFKIPAVKSAEIADQKGNVLISIRKDPDDPAKLAYHFKENYADKFTEQEVLDKIKEEKNSRTMDLKVLLQVESTIHFERVQSLMIGVERMGLKTPVAKVAPKVSTGSSGAPSDNSP